jgi:hypothetical protein
MLCMLQATLHWLREAGVVRLVLKSNLHQAQYAEQVGHALVMVLINATSHEWVVPSRLICTRRSKKRSRGRLVMPLAPLSVTTHEHDGGWTMVQVQNASRQYAEQTSGWEAFMAPLWVVCSDCW